MDSAGNSRDLKECGDIGGQGGTLHADVGILSGMGMLQEDGGAWRTMGRWQEDRELQEHLGMLQEDGDLRGLQELRDIGG